MYHIHETLEAYNWFCALVMGFINDKNTSWIARDMSINDYDLKIIKLMGELKGDLEYPFCKTVYNGYNDNEILYKIHIYVDTEHNWNGITCRHTLYKHGIFDIPKIHSVLIPEDILTLDISLDKINNIEDKVVNINSEDALYFSLREYFKEIFGAMFGDTRCISRYSDHVFGMYEILANIFLLKFTTYDMNRAYDYYLGVTDKQNKETFNYVDDIAEFAHNQEIERVNMIKNSVETIMENEGDNYLNPQINKPNEFIKVFSEILSFNKLQDLEYDQFYSHRYSSFTGNDTNG